MSHQDGFWLKTFCLVAHDMCFCYRLKAREEPTQLLVPHPHLYGHLVQLRHLEILEHFGLASWAPELESCLVAVLDREDNEAL